jgi:transcription elongation factor Elf1
MSAERLKKELKMTHQRKGRAMNGSCRKCGGFLIVERVLDYHCSAAGIKCINCGWYRLDAQRILNQADGVRNRGAYK